MGKVILGFTMSLDGFINDRNESVADLYHDLDTLRYAEPLKESIQDTGAVVMGRKTFAMGDPDTYAGNYEYQVPIFVVTKNPPKKQPKQTDQLTFTFVRDGVESAIQQAKASAGDKDVTIVGGAEIAAQCLNAKIEALANRFQAGFLDRPKPQEFGIKRRAGKAGEMVNFSLQKEPAGKFCRLADRSQAFNVNADEAVAPGTRHQGQARR